MLTLTLVADTSDLIHSYVIIHDTNTVVALYVVFLFVFPLECAWKELEQTHHRNNDQIGSLMLTFQV